MRYGIFVSCEAGEGLMEHFRSLDLPKTTLGHYPGGQDGL